MSNRSFHVVNHVQTWLKNLVIGFNFCPFAKKEFEANAIRYQVSNAETMEMLLAEIESECQFLDGDEYTATTLLIYPNQDLLDHFEAYLDFVDAANLLLAKAGYEGVYQLATFHPDYCFAGEDKDAASNYTNRSPYPIIHILREDAIEQALTHVSDASKIPERNIRYANSLGVARMREALLRCFDLN